MTERKDSVLLGHLSLITCNVVWGVMAPFSKDVMNTGMISAWSLSGARVVGGALVFWLISLLVPDKWLKHEKVEKADLLQLFWASMLLMVASMSLNIVGTKYTSPIDATVVCSITPVLTLIFSAFLIHEKITWLKTLGVALGFAGVLAFIFNGQSNVATQAENPMLGNALCFLSQVCGALYLVLFGKVLRKYSSFTAMKWMFLMSAVVMFPFLITGFMETQWMDLPMSGWFDIAFIVLIGSVLCYLLLPFGQRTVSPTAVAMYNYLRPVASAVLSILMGLALLDWQTSFYSVLIFAGVYLVNRKK